MAKKSGYIQQNNEMVSNPYETLVAPDAKGEIVLYQPDETIRLEVRLEYETVWLTQAQMALLFGRDRSVIGKHVSNCFREGELNAEEVCANFAHTTTHGAIEGKVQVHDVTYYNLDVIISVGYRVKSPRGTKFRQWATGVLKKYILQGAAISQRLHFVKEEIDARLLRHEQQLSDIQSKVDFFVQTSLPPVQGIFFDGQIFDAYHFASDLIRKAKRSITLNRAHDRFLLIDEEVCHIGASLKDLGKKWFAFTKMNDIIAKELINRI